MRYVGTMSLDCARPSDELLDALAEPALDRIDAARVAAVLAHPDDETIGCGAQLRRLDGAAVVIVTDGAPRNLHDAHRLGFETAAEYAAERERELATALGMAGVRPDRVVGLRVPDQATAFRLVETSLELAQLFAERRVRSVITHAYEGGHPDHDATAFCVHSAVALRRRGGGDGTHIIEIPLYSLGPHGVVRQEFTAGLHAAELVLRLTAEQQELKRQMLAAHRTQRDVLARFSLEVERFRRAPPYDFIRLPNDGRLLYEAHRWGLDGRRWSGLTRSALTDLGLGGAPC
jgi:N-acetylglucosamine malate deacetylase 2